MNGNKKTGMVLARKHSIGEENGSATQPPFFSITDYLDFDDLSEKGEGGTQDEGGEKLPEEIKAKLRNKEWRLNHLYKILDKDGQIRRLILNYEQQQVLNLSGNKFIILKARQLGMTTFCLIDALDDCIFTPNYIAGVIAHQLEAMFSLFEIIKRAWTHFPESLKNMLGDVRLTRTSITFPHGSKLSVALSYRSGTLSRLHVSELGKMAKKFPERAKEVITGSFPTVASGRLSVESTAEGVGGIFHELWLGAPDNGFTPLFFSWTKHPEYTAAKNKINTHFLSLQRRFNLTAEQISWYYSKYKEMGDDIFQEFPLSAEMAFLQTGHAVFDSRYLFVSCKAEDPVPNRHYVVGGDPASGESNGKDPDRSSLDVLDWETGNQVYHWAGREKPDEFAARLYTISKKYNNAVIGCERNNHGILTIYKLEEFGANQHITKSYSRRREIRKDKWGWETNKLTKPLIIDELEEDLRKGNIGISSKKTAEELLSYETKENGEMGAVEGCHDDRVMSLAIANRMRKENPPKNYRPSRNETPGEGAPVDPDNVLKEINRHKNIQKSIIVGG